MNALYLWTDCMQAGAHIERSYPFGRAMLRAMLLQVFNCTYFGAIPWRERRQLLAQLNQLEASLAKSHGRTLAHYDIAGLIALGYRRVSNAHGMVARIDRPDYLEHMAREYRKAPADFMVPEGRAATGSWDDHYRRCFSKDVLRLPPEIAKLVPSSCHDATGYRT